MADITVDRWSSSTNSDSVAMVTTAASGEGGALPEAPLPHSSDDCSSAASWFDGVGGDDDNASTTSSSHYGGGDPDDSEHGRHHAHQKRKQEQRSTEEHVLSRKDRRTVLYFRLLLVTVLFCSATAVGVLTYTYTSRWEWQQFESQYREDSLKVLQSVGRSLDLTLEGLDAFMVSLVRMARATNQTWPYVTVSLEEGRLLSMYRCGISCHCVRSGYRIIAQEILVAFCLFLSTDSRFCRPG